MSQTTAKALVPGSVMGAGAVTYYTAGAGTRGIVKSASIVNTTGGTIAATLYKVPNGGAAAAANTVISGRNVAAGETYNCPELINHVVEPGGFIQGLGNGLTLMISGAEVVS